MDPNGNENDGLVEHITRSPTESSKDNGKEMIESSDGLRKRVTKIADKSGESEEKENKKPLGNFLQRILNCVTDDKETFHEKNEELLKKEKKSKIDDLGLPEKEEETDDDEEESEDEDEEEKLDEDLEDEGDPGDYIYDEWSREYIPRIREPPSDEDSEDGLLISSKEREASLSGIAEALLESAKLNQAIHEKEKSRMAANRSLYDDFIYCCGGSKKLLHIDNMPTHLQFNKFVHWGYRDLQDSWGCFLSLFYIHNETVNVLTHLIPIIYILLYWKTMFPWDEIVGNPFLNALGCAHIAACISPWIGSVTYHLFMNHERGSNLYQMLLRLDMFGIWVTQSFGALTNLCAAVWCLSTSTQTMILTSYGLASFLGLQKALTAWTPVARRMCFLPVLLSRIIAFAFRFTTMGGGNPAVVLHIVLQDVISVAGGIIGVARIPEKWIPGKLDYIFNSHHIMHVMVVVAVTHLNKATNGDVRWIIDNYSWSAQPQCYLNKTMA